MIEKNTMNTSRYHFKHSLSPVFAFLVTAVVIIILFAIYEYAPFGKASILLSDLKTQYAPALVAYRNLLLSEGSLSYSFFIGMGKNVFGWFAYYLSSPLNMLALLFPAGKIDQAVVLLIILKLSFAASFLTLYLEKKSGLRNKISAIFGVMYALSSYSIIYMINIMWLDGFMLLPLVLFFTEKFLADRRKWFPLVIVFFVLFASGYYIAYMVGVFSFLYLLAVLWKNRKFDSENKLASGKLTAVFLGCAALAGGLAAILLVPAALDTLRNPDYYANSFSLASNFTPISLLDQMFSGTFDSLSTNKPYIYCGLASFLLVLLFFQNPAFSKRTKRFVAAAIVFFLFSFHFSPMDQAWHLFDRPNWFHHRYSFLFVFILLVIAYFSFIRIKSIPPKAFIRTGLIFLVAILIVQSFGDMRADGERFYINLFMGGIILLVLYAVTVTKWRDSVARLKVLSIPLLVMVILVDVLLVNPLYVRAKAFGGAYVAEDFANVYEEAEGLVAIAKEMEDESNNQFFRMEIDDHLGTEISAISGALLLDYHSVSNFLSVSNKPVNRMLKQLGYATNYNYFTSSHSFSAIVPDSLLGITYVISEREDCADYELVAFSKGGEFGLYRNGQALPLLYPVKADASDFDFYVLENQPDNKNLFSFQEALLLSLFDGADSAEPVYHEASVSEPVVYNAILQRDRVEETSEEGLNSGDMLGNESSVIVDEYLIVYLRINESDCISLEYKVDISSADPLYLSVPTAAINSKAVVYANGEKVGTMGSSLFSQIQYLGRFTPGQTVTVKIVVDGKLDEFAFLGADFAYCDTDKFVQIMTNSFQQDSVEILVAEDGHISAQISADEDRLLLTTIPYEPGWELLVDGEKADIVAYQGALMSIPLEKGDHTISLHFTAPGLVAGTIISGISLVGLLALIGCSFFFRRKKK